MRQLDLFALVRSTLVAHLAGMAEVRAVYQPQQEGLPSAPSVLLQQIGAKRIGAPRRDYQTGLMTQWWETTLQIGAVARRDPNDPAFLTLPSALDICKAAANALQNDMGLAALAVQRVRPLRITDIRNLQWLNESDQYEAMPNFDLVLSHPETTDNAAPPVDSFEPGIGRA